MEDKYVKLTHHNGINRGFQFKEGLNTDIYELNEEEGCAKGGLYFCKFKDVGIWIYEFGKDVLIWDVEIPKGEKVIEYPDKLKAKSIILSNPTKAYDNYDICLQAVKYKGICLEFIENQTEELFITAVIQSGQALQFVKEQTYFICCLAVKQNGNSLMYVKEQTPELCEIAIKKDPVSFRYVKNQTPELCILAVQLSGFNLQFIKEQTPEYCKLAVNQNGLSLEYVKEQNNDICILAVLQNKKAIKFVKEKPQEFYDGISMNLGKKLILTN